MGHLINMDDRAHKYTLTCIMHALFLMADSKLTEDAYYAVHKAVNLVDLIDTDLHDIHFMFETLMNIYQGSKEITLKESVGCAIWKLTAKWLVVHPMHRKHVEEILMHAVAEIGKDFLLKCNDVGGNKSPYENAFHAFHPNSKCGRVLTTLHAWVVGNA